ncbi:MAG: radical SAM protein [Clostridia bacterium]|jgi:putative pyruvate formate lyase activating enzyme
MKTNCNICPRNCNTDRETHKGYCNAPNDIVLAKAVPFHFEEPVISGKNGTGAVFFSGCNLKCCYCQNYKISHELYGKVISLDHFCNILLSMNEKNLDSISFISPTIYVNQIIKALDIIKPKINVPIVYNTSGYEKPETIKMLDGYIDVYIPDIKYINSIYSERYSNASDYFDYCSKSVIEMISQKPYLKYNGSILTSGVLIRHLVLPGLYKDSINILKWIRKTLDESESNCLISIMSQYMPYYLSTNYPEINRKITKYEYSKVVETASSLNLQGFIQDKCSSEDIYVPDFDLKGVI